MSNSITTGGVYGKLWGNTQCLFKGPYSEMHCIHINEGGYCSKHKHKHKWNRFVVISGKLEIVIFNDDNDSEDITTITSGQFSDVPPEKFHIFRALEQTICIEIYWIDGIDPIDIDRESVGGIQTPISNNSSHILPALYDPDSFNQDEMNYVVTH